MYEIEPFKVLAEVLDVYEGGWQHKVVSERKSETETLQITVDRAAQPLCGAFVLQNQRIPMGGRD